MPPLPSSIHHRYFHLVMVVPTLLIIAFSAWGLSAQQIRVDWFGLMGIGFLLVLLFIGILVYRYREMEKLEDLMIAAFWGILVTNLYIFPMYIAARFHPYYYDASLAAIDSLFGLEVPTVLAAVAAVPGLELTLAIAYDLLLIMLAMALLVLPLTGQMARLKQMLLASLMAAMICIPIFAVLPAIGSWDYYQVKMLPRHQLYMKVITALKGEGAFHLHPGTVEGIITFPSFHTILAWLSAWGLWKIPYVRWGSATLAGMITLSCVTVGGHYLVDVWVGGIIAVLVLYLARGFIVLEQRWEAADANSNRMGDNS